jgi:CRP-like cAMP-binding protein
MVSAKRWMLKVVEIEPSIAQAYRGACLVCFKLGEYDQAVQIIE